MKKNRLIFSGFVLFCLVGLVIWRLVEVQILQHESWSSQARSIQERQVEINPVRGTIFDRQGRELALNTRAYSLAVDPFDMSKPERMVEILHRQLGKGKEELRDLIYRPSYFVWIDRQVDYWKGEAIKSQARQENVDGLILLDSWERAYPREELGAAILGFTGIDGEGLSGVEFSLDGILAGEPTVKQIIYGANRIPYREKTLKEGQPGYDLYLTIDSRVQHVTEKALRSGVKRFEAKDGWAVVMDPENGELLALAQKGSFDPNNYGEYRPERWKNEAIAHTFEPGSILKVFTALAALKYGAAGPETKVNGNSPVLVSGHPVQNAQYRDYGVITLSEAIKHSVNTAIVRIARRLGKERLYQFLTEAGFGRKTGVRLPGEEGGRLRPVRQWSDLAIGAIPIGQAISVNAVQLASRVAAVANGGSVVKPKIVKEIVNPEEEGEGTGERRGGSHRLVSASTAAQVEEMMCQVVEDGTGQAAQLPGYQVCGKTGTAQKAAPGGGYSRDKYISSFVGYFPRENPRYLILVVLDEVGTWPVWGGATAGNVFKDIATRILALRETS